MKIFTAIVVLSLALLSCSAARAASSPLELVLSDDHVTFFNNTNISFDVVFRNVGKTNMHPLRLLLELRVVVDGTEYARDSKENYIYSGLRFIQPGSGMHDRIGLSEFVIPAPSLSPGRHAIWLKEGDEISNRLTIFIEEIKNPDPS